MTLAPNPEQKRAAAGILRVEDKAAKIMVAMRLVREAGGREPMRWFGVVNT
jgi:hypothetical protein